MSLDEKNAGKRSLPFDPSIDREELVASVKKLTRIILDKLEEGSKDGTIDQAQTKLYGSIITRSLCIWLEALSPRPRRRIGRNVHEEIDRMYRKMLQEKETRP